MSWVFRRRGGGSVMLRIMGYPLAYGLSEFHWPMVS